MIRIITVFALILVVVLHWPGTPRAAQRSAEPSASISGIVALSDESAAPVRRAILTLARAGGESRTTATDDQGRYLFANLPAGVYTLNASKGGFVPIAYGAARIGLPGSPIPLVDGQHFAATPIRIARGGVITGTLTAKGQPLRIATVEAVQFHLVDGVRRRRTFTGASGRSLTDSRGVYRIHSLPPGDYLVNVTSPTMFIGGDILEMTAAEIQSARTQSARGATAPALPSGRPVTAAEVPAGRSFTYAPTCFPGTADAAAATVVSLRAGEERGGVDFSVLGVPTAEISGVVVDTDGVPLPGSGVGRVARNPNYLLAMFGLDRVVPTDQNGRFVRTAVPPGEYTLVVRPTRGEPMMGLLDVSVNGDDLSDLRIQMRPAASISGRVVFNSTLLTPPRELVRIQPRLLTPSGAAPVIRPESAVVSTDGAFRINQVAPGRYLMTVTASGLDPSWVLESISVQGRNVLDVPLDVADGQSITDALITFSDRAAELSGTLTDAQGRPTPQYFVLVYPVQRAYWRTASRWIRSARAGVDGSFRITGMPAGDYYVCALTEIDPDQQYDEAYLGQFVGGSIRITLGEAERRVQHLRVGGA